MYTIVFIYKVSKGSTEHTKSLLEKSHNCKKILIRRPKHSVGDRSWPV